MPPALAPQPKSRDPRARPFPIFGCAAVSNTTTNPSALSLKPSVGKASPRSPSRFPSSTAIKATSLPPPPTSIAPSSKSSASPSPFANAPRPSSMNTPTPNSWPSSIATKCSPVPRKPTLFSTKNTASCSPRTLASSKPSANSSSSTPNTSWPSKPRGPPASPSKVSSSPTASKPPPALPTPTAPYAKPISPCPNALCRPSSNSPVRSRSQLATYFNPATAFFWRRGALLAATLVCRDRLPRRSANSNTYRSVTNSSSLLTVADIGYLLARLSFRTYPLQHTSTPVALTHGNFPRYCHTWRGCVSRERLQL